ncbi:hypothetical protein P8452_54378 [Trifolium repens]|nr:hypothetical protein P8452_54378 [Trifolium repens]
MRKLNAKENSYFGSGDSKSKPKLKSNSIAKKQNGKMFCPALIKMFCFFAIELLFNFGLLFESPDPKEEFSLPFNFLMIENNTLSVGMARGMNDSLATLLTVYGLLYVLIPYRPP